MDADGRRVASTRLLGTAPVDVARVLKDALTAKPTERIFLKANDDEADLSRLVEALGAIDGVLSVEEESDGVAATTRPGVLGPARVSALISASKTDVRLTQPVAVRVQGAKDDADVAAAVARVPGVWFATESDAPTVWISRFLVHPDRLSDVGLTSDIASHRLRFASLPQGGGVVQHLWTPFEHDGVVAVIPHVANSTIEVVGRRDTFDANSLEATFVEAGLELRGSR